ncbi:hypothetical protein BH20PSE1_BH20PSE1_01140 [soil metagenome]
MSPITLDVHLHVEDLGDVKTIARELAKLFQCGETIMTAISDFAAAQAAFNDRMATAIDGLQTDITALNAKIDELQSTPGAITPEDQMLLDDLQVKGDAIATKLEALDNLTPPAVPAA